MGGGGSGFIQGIISIYYKCNGARFKCAKLINTNDGRRIILLKLYNKSCAIMCWNFHRGYESKRGYRYESAGYIKYEVIVKIMVYKCK